MLEDKFLPVRIDDSELRKYLGDYITACYGKSSRTLYTYVTALREFCEYKESQSDFAFLVEDMESYRNYLELVRGMKPNTIKTYLTALRKFTNFLVNNSVLPKNPAKRIKYNPVHKPLNVEFLTDDEIVILLKSIDKSTITGLRDTAVLAVILETCCSESEIANANIKNFQIYRKKPYFMVPSLNGMENERFLLDDAASKALIAYLKSRGSVVSEEEPLFVSNSNYSYNKRLTVRCIREIIVSSLRVSGIRKESAVSPSIIRRTAAARLAKSGKTREYIMKRLNLKLKESVEKYFT